MSKVDKYPQRAVVGGRGVVCLVVNMLSSYFGDVTSKLCKSGYSFNFAKFFKIHIKELTFIPFTYQTKQSKYFCSARR